jgi:hypothetical protein
MERSQLFDLMGELQLYGMKAAFDEIMTTAVKPTAGLTDRLRLRATRRGRRPQSGRRGTAM